MKIQARKTQFVEVELEKRDMKNVTIEYLYSMLKLTKPWSHADHYFIDKGFVMHSYEEDAGHHSYTKQEKIREATPLDLLILPVIDEVGKSIP